MQLLTAPPLRDDEVRRLQQHKVLRHALAGHGEVLAEFAERSSVMGVQNVQQLSPTGIGERLEQQISLIPVSRHGPTGKYLLAYNAQALTCMSTRNLWRAGQDAADSLSRFFPQRETVAELTAARDAAARSEELTLTRYAGGAASPIDRLDTERQRISTEQSLAQAQAMLTHGYVALQKSLGFGWRAPGPPLRKARA